MFKPSITVHKSNDGVVKVLEASEDATKCLDAYHNCEEPGEVVYIRKGHTDKMKRIIESESPPAKKATKAKK